MQLKTQNNKYQWKCDKRIKGCSATIWTLLKNKKHYIIESKNEHNCMSNELRLQIKEILNKLEELKNLGEDAPEMIVKSIWDKAKERIRSSLISKLVIFEIIFRNDENDYDYSPHVIDFEKIFSRSNAIQPENMCEPYSSSNGTIHLLHENYSYTNMNRMICGATYWRCDNALKSLCMSKIYTVFENNMYYIAHRKFSHSCLPEPYKKEVAIFLNNFKESCQRLSIPIENIIDIETQKWPSEVVKRLPLRRNLINIGIRVRGHSFSINIDDQDSDCEVIEDDVVNDS